MGIEGFFKKGPVYLDTNIFIYALEDFPAYAVPIKKIFKIIDKGAVTAFTSEFTLAEALIKPFILQNDSLISLYQDIIRDSSVLSVQPVTRQTLILAARIRAQSTSRISLADAIHLATANIMQCHSFLTNDRRLLRQKLDNLEILLLENFAGN